MYRCASFGSSSVAFRQRSSRYRRLAINRCLRVSSRWNAATSRAGRRPPHARLDHEARGCAGQGTAGTSRSARRSGLRSTISELSKSRERAWSPVGRFNNTLNSIEPAWFGSCYCIAVNIAASLLLAVRLPPSVTTCFNVMNSLVSPSLLLVSRHNDEMRD